MIHISTGDFMLPTDPGALVIYTGAVLAALAGIGRWIVLPSFRLARAIWHFLEGWNGEPARDGQPAVPGLLERVHRIESEVTRNGGSSLKDAVIRTEETLRAHLEDSEASKAAAVEESTEMWRAIRSVAESTPPEDQ
jgi:hypothetical protein